MPIVGPAGVGKTALAVYWAHRVRDRLPDGQLYGNLRAFDPAGSGMRPAEAIAGFLDASDVPPQQVPADPRAQIGLFRSIMADLPVPTTPSTRCSGSSRRTESPMAHCARRASSLCHRYQALTAAGSPHDGPDPEESGPSRVSDYLPLLRVTLLVSLTVTMLPYWVSYALAWVLTSASPL